MPHLHIQMRDTLTGGDTVHIIDRCAGTHLSREAVLAALHATHKQAYEEANIDELSLVAYHVRNGTAVFIYDFQHCAVYGQAEMKALVQQAPKGQVHWLNGAEGRA